MGERTGRRREGGNEVVVVFDSILCIGDGFAHAGEMADLTMGRSL